MKILGVDPGAVKMGVAVLDKGELLDYRLLSYSRGRKSFNKALNERIVYCVEKFSEILDTHKPDLVVTEIVPSFKSMAHREQIVACITVLKTLTVERSIKLVEFSPRSWHKLWVGKADCTKDEVKSKVVETYKVVVDMPYDVYDAVAIATVGWEQRS